MARYRCGNGHAGPFQLNTDVSCGWVARVDDGGAIRVGAMQYCEPSGAVWVISCRAPGCDWATEPTGLFPMMPLPLTLAEGVWDLVTDLRPRRRSPHQGGTRDR
jgi:hypothetical protein